MFSESHTAGGDYKDSKQNELKKNSIDSSSNEKFIISESLFKGCYSESHADIARFANCILNYFL